MDAPPAPRFRHAALFAFLAALAALVLAVALGRAGFLVDPLRAQVEHRPGAGYTTNSLVVWGLVGGLGVLAYAQEARDRPLLQPSNRTLACLIPALAFGPLFHALLVVDAVPSPLGWLAAEPLVYATVAGVVLAAGALGAVAYPQDRAAGRDVAILSVGAIALLAAGAAAAPRLGPDAGFALGLVVFATLVGLAAWWLGTFVKRAGYENLSRPFAVAVYAGHALDGATTWIGVRDPFGWGVGGFSEKNPVSAQLLSIGNGWPFVLLKLVLPAVLLVALRDLKVEFHARLALLAVFALGFGPGAANALQMALRGGP